MDAAAGGGEVLRSGVMEPGAGDITTRGPVHLDRRATTSASKSKSENETFGWDLSCCQAVFVGMVSLSEGMDEDMDICVGGFGRSDLGFERRTLEDSGVQRSSGVHGQSSQDVNAATDLPIAAQNAFPKESSAQARQLLGSPEQFAGLSFWG